MCHNNADLINTQFCLILVGLNMNSNCYMNNNEHCHTVPLLVRIRLVFINVVHSLEDEVAIALFWWGNGVTEDHHRLGVLIIMGTVTGRRTSAGHVLDNYSEIHVTRRILTRK